MTKLELVKATRARQREARQAKGRLLSLPAASEYTGIPYETLRGIVARGELAAVRIPGGRSLFVERAELDRALEAWKVRA